MVIKFASLSSWSFQSNLFIYKMIRIKIMKDKTITNNVVPSSIDFVTATPQVFRIVLKFGENL